MLLDLPIDGIGVAGDHLLSQAGAAGWRIDDLICVGHAANGPERRLALSCKSNVQVTATGWPADFVSSAWELGASKTRSTGSRTGSGWSRGAATRHSMRLGRT